MSTGIEPDAMAPQGLSMLGAFILKPWDAKVKMPGIRHEVGPADSKIG
jgi:hypothetical protein